MPLIAVDQPPADKNSPASDNSGVTPISLSEANSSSDANAKILKQYTVAKGDTLGKLAHRFYGTSSHAAVEAILNANPQLKGNAARLAVGKTYNIPVFAKGEQAASVAKDSRQSKEKFAMVDTNTLAVEPTTKPAAQALASKTRNHAVAGSSYTVKSGDTFWKIASRELGSRRQWKQIEELNPGALHHGQLKVGTVLKLPAKTVATAD
jgi:LysM repeat protein